MSSRPLYKVFEQRAQGIGHILRDRGIWRMTGFAANEAMHDYQYNNDDGSVTLAFTRKSDGKGRIEFRNVKASGLSEVNFGEETVLKSEFLGSNEEIVDNRTGTGEIEVSFRDLFAKSDEKSKETSKSAGTSVSVTVSASESIEGVADFEESVTAEAHAEYSESESSTTSTSKEEEGEESTTVPVGKRVRITENRSRADTQQEVTARGDFTFGIAAGKHSGGKFVGGHNGYWDSWSDFCDAVRGEAPDNICLAESFKHRHPWHNGPVGAEPAELRGEVQRQVRGPRHADLQSGGILMTVSELIAALQKRSGNEVVGIATEPGDVKQALALDPELAVVPTPGPTPTLMVVLRPKAGESK